MESHMIHITQRAHMSLTGLEKVISMEPELVEVETTADHLAIKGQNLHAEKLDMEKGELQLTGTIQGMLYSDKKGKEESRGDRQTAVSIIDRCIDTTGCHVYHECCRGNRPHTVV